MNRSAALVALVPPPVVTAMSTVPLPAGEVAVIEVELLTVNDVALVLPNLTAVAPVKLVPVMATPVPPVVGPEFGFTLVTVGAVAATQLAVTVLLPSASLIVRVEFSVVSPLAPVTV